MANAERGEVGLVIDGRPYTLRATLNAQCVAESLTKLTYDELMLAANKGSASAWRALLWSMLQACHANEFKTLADVGALVDQAGGLNVVIDSFKEAEELNRLPADEASQAEGSGSPLTAPVARAGRGSGSSSRRAASH